MASGMSDTLAASILDAIFNGSPFSFTPYLAAMTTASTATAFGTEVTGGSYARQPLSAASAAGHTASSDATLVFPGCPAGTWAGLTICDTASGTPTRWWYIDGLSITVAAGENKTIGVGDLTASIS